VVGDARGVDAAPRAATVVSTAVGVVNSIFLRATFAVASRRRTELCGPSSDAAGWLASNRTLSNCRPALEWVKIPAEAPSDPFAPR